MLVDTHHARVGLDRRPLHFRRSPGERLWDCPGYDKRSPFSPTYSDMDDDCTAPRYLMDIVPLSLMEMRPFISAPVQRRLDEQRPSRRGARREAWTALAHARSQHTNAYAS